MATLGDIAVRITADATSFSSEMTRAASISRDKLASIQSVATKVGAAIGASMAAGATAMSYMVKQSIDAADANTKLAQSAGVSVEALTSIGYAAGLSGSSTEELGKALGKLGKQSSDAANGTGEAVNAFKAMGISVKDANGNLKSSDVIFKEVADKFASYEDGANKSALASKIFGEEGLKLIPMLNQGSAGIAAMEAEAAALGVTMDGQTGKSAEAFNDNLTRLGAATSGLTNKVAAELLPSLVKMTDKLIKSTEGAQLMETAAKTAATGVRLLASAGALVVGVFKTIGEALGGVAAAVVAIFEGRFRDAFNIAEQVALDFKGNLEGTASSISGMWETAAANVQANAPVTGEKIAAPMIVAAEKAKKAAEKIDEIEKLILQKEKQIADEGMRIFEQTRTPAEQLNATYARLNYLLEEGAIDWDTYARATMDAQDKLLGLDEAGKTTASNIETVITNAFQGMGDAIADFVMGGKASFGDMVNAMIRDLIRLEVQTTMTTAFKNAGGFSGIVSAIGSWISGGTTPTGHANGGLVTAGTTYLVGERGPELLTMGSQGGTITSNAAMGGGAPSITINVTNEGAADGYKASASTSVNQAGGIDVAVLVRRELASDMRQNGPITQGFANTFGLRRGA